MKDSEIVKKLVFILDCYEGGVVVVSNQGQALDGYSALAEFVWLAKGARSILKEKEKRVYGSCGAKQEVKSGARC